MRRWLITAIVLSLLALATTIAIAQYGALSIRPRPAHLISWVQWDEPGAQISMAHQESLLASEFLVYAVHGPPQQWARPNSVKVPEYFRPIAREIDDAARKAGAGSDVRWREIACGWPMRSLRCRVESQHVVRGGWFRHTPTDAFEAQVVPVVPWQPIPLGLLADWLGALAAWTCLWLMLLGLWRLGVGWRRRRADRHTRCHACGYSLEGLRGEVCPECGTRLSGTRPGVATTDNRT